MRKNSNVFSIFNYKVRYRFYDFIQRRGKLSHCDGCTFKPLRVEPYLCTRFGNTRAVETQHPINADESGPTLQ